MMHNEPVCRDRSQIQAHPYASNGRNRSSGKSLERDAVWVLNRGRDSSLYHHAKRIIDVVVSTLLLVLLLPLMALIGVLIRLDSPGPALFRQKRVGARRRRSNDGQTVWEIQDFWFYKFRSMFADCDQSIHQAHIKAVVKGTLDTLDADKARFKLRDDPRITRLGRILRKTSLDELPQLFNVLKGEMSLVGPRPVPAYEVAEYDEWHRERLAALPGITGLWQVKGRGRVTFEEMMEMDISYVRNSSLVSDIRILLLTVPAALAQNGAR